MKMYKLKKKDNIGVYCNLTWDDIHSINKMLSDRGLKVSMRVIWNKRVIMYISGDNGGKYMVLVYNMTTNYLYVKHYIILGVWEDLVKHLEEKGKII